jgi:hypothetical protein
MQLSNANGANCAIEVEGLVRSGGLRKYPALKPGKATTGLGMRNSQVGGNSQN